VRAGALAALAAVALVGCGDERERFRNDLRPLEERAESQRVRISAELRALRLGRAATARELRVDTAALERINAEIAQLEPPDDYEEPFETYVRANKRTVSGLERLADRVAAGDARGVRMAGRAVADGLGQSQSARLRWLE
jgi:hypothetical protein